MEDTAIVKGHTVPFFSFQDMHSVWYVNNRPCSKLQVSKETVPFSQLTLCYVFYNAEVLQPQERQLDILKAKAPGHCQQSNVLGGEWRKKDASLNNSPAESFSICTKMDWRG